MEFIQATHDKPLTVMYIDLIGLHEINNHLGHARGDVVLCELADAARAYFGDDNIYRIGGDEFCVILTRRNAQYNTMTEIFQHLMDAARAENPVLPTVSVGCSHFNPSTNDLADSLARADARMYQNKEAHR